MLSQQQLADWCASIGQTSADLLAIRFRLPASRSIIATFETEMSEEVGAIIDATTHATDEERHHLMNVAWIAFDQRLAIHRPQRPFSGRHQCGFSKPILNRSYIFRFFG